MKTDDLISKLSAEIVPVRTIENFYRRFLKWLLSAFLCVSAGIALLGLREDWQTIFNNPILLAQNILILLGVIFSAATALLLCVPGSEKKLATKLLISAPLLLWASLLVFGNVQSAQFQPGLGINCIIDICVLGLIPGIFLFVLVQRGAALMRGYVGFLALFASAGLGAWALQFTCHNDEPAHILLWHFLPVLLLGLLGMKLGKLLLKKI